MPRVPPSYNQQNVSTYFQSAVRSTVTRQAETQCSGTSPLTLYYRSQCHGHHLEACYKYTAPSPTSELMNPNLHLTRSLANVNAHWFGEAPNRQLRHPKNGNKMHIGKKAWHGGRPVVGGQNNDRRQDCRIKRDPEDTAPQRTHESTKIVSGKTTSVKSFNQRKTRIRFVFKNNVHVCAVLLSL